MVQKINHTSNMAKPSPTSPTKSAKVTADNAAPAQSNLGVDAALNTAQRLTSPLPTPKLATQLSVLMQRLITLDPAAAQKINQVLAQLFPTTPEQMLTLLSHLLAHPKHQFKGLILLWLNLRKQPALDKGLSSELSQLLEKMQLKHIDQTNQHLWLLQLPWFVEHQLKHVQLKIVKPKTKQGKRKWQLKLKLPTRQSEMLADAWFDETDINLKFYCDNQLDLDLVSQYSPLLLNQLNQAGFNVSCQEYMGQLPPDLVAEFEDKSQHLDILV